MPLNIAFLDDEPALCELFKETFESQDINIKTYVDPEVAISDINLSMPGLVFIDYRLPKMTGDEVAKRINESIPKVMITGDLNIVLGSDFIKIFKKPYSFEEMFHFIHSKLSD
jgi:FixJ family two-component response regulator